MIYNYNGVLITASTRKEAIQQIKASTSKKTLEKISKKMDNEYEFLYNHKDNVPDYREAVDSFDSFSKKNKRFIGEFIKFRGDFITSDREAAAFMLALDDLGMLNDNNSLKIVANSWSKKELDELGISESELKKLSSTLRKETFEVA